MNIRFLLGLVRLCPYAARPAPGEVAPAAVRVRPRPRVVLRIGPVLLLMPPGRR